MTDLTRSSDLRLAGNARDRVLDNLPFPIDVELRDAVDAAFTEAVYDAARTARLQLLGRLPRPEPSQRAWDMLRRVRKRTDAA